MFSIGSKLEIVFIRTIDNIPYKLDNISRSKIVGEVCMIKRAPNRTTLKIGVLTIKHRRHKLNAINTTKQSLIKANI